MLQNETTKWARHGFRCVFLCPFCRHWGAWIGGTSVYRNRRVCAACTWIIAERRKAPPTI